jgi:hypothetical protein
MIGLKRTRPLRRWRRHHDEHRQPLVTSTQAPHEFFHDYCESRPQVTGDGQSAASVAPIIAELKAAGITRLSGIAAALNARGVLTPTGRRFWSSSQIAQLLRRLER